MTEAGVTIGIATDGTVNLTNVANYRSLFGCRRLALRRHGWKFARQW